MQRSNLAEKIPEDQRDWWRPPERITVPDWVEKNVRLPRFTSAEPGPLRISRTPYTKGPLLSLGSPFIEQIVLVWGRQLGKSQGVQYPFLCYCIAQDSGPAICLLPTIDKAKYTSKKRLQPMFNACEAVRKEKTNNPDDMTLMEMQFQNMILSMAWGGSEMQLTTRPARYLFRDEVDELKKTVGQNAVDPMKAIEQTTSNFSNRKIVDTGTPTTPEGNIWEELKTCQYVFEYWVACPHCGVYQILYWENVRFGEDHDPIVVEENAYYECEACQKDISNLDKIRILAGGEWRARTTEAPCNQIMKNIRAKVEETISLNEILDKSEYRRIKKIGFHLPKWYSPFSGGTFGIIAKEFLEANNSLKEGDDFAPMRNWRIYNAARPWEEVAISETEIELMKNKIDLPSLICPQGTIALTAGIDPGQGGFWFSVLAWKRDYGAHLVQYGWLAGDYDNSGIEEMIRDWTFQVDQEQRAIHIWRIGIDTGGGQYAQADTTMTEAAYLWIRKMKWPGLFGTKGQSRETVRRLKETRLDKMPGDKGAMIPGGLILIEINTDAMKDVMWFHLRIEEGKPGRFTFNNATESDYAKHLLAEDLRLQKDGKWEWVRIRKDNHLLDCFDDKTEVLTKSGWKKFKKVELTDECATVNLKNDFIEYQKPTRLIDKPYKGEMINLKGRRVDILVTPNHRMVTYRKKYHGRKIGFEYSCGPSIKKAKELDIWDRIKLTARWHGKIRSTIKISPSDRVNGGLKNPNRNIRRLKNGRYYVRVMNRGIITSQTSDKLKDAKSFRDQMERKFYSLEPKRSITSEDWAEFLGWFVSEGSKYIHRNQKGHPNYHVLLSQMPGKKKNRIKDLLNRLPWHFREEKNDFRINSKQLYEALEECGENKYSKQVPNWVKNNGHNIIEIFLNAAIAGDGWIQHGFRTYATVSEQLADDMQELFIKTGSASNLKIRPPQPYNIQGRKGENTKPQYHVTECKTKTLNLRDGKNKSLIKKVDYDGMVYCVSVPNGTLVCRREGKSFIAGNCTVIAFSMADSEFRGGIRLVRTPKPKEESPFNPLTGKPRGGWMEG